ncbi:MAG: hypothetical protein ABSG53_31380, partial [Thermoguttaceae bacterium]
MRRSLLFGAGLFFGLLAEALLWEGPRWYTSDGRVAGLGFIALGAGFVVWAACCLSRAFVALCPPSAQNKTPLSGQASATVRGRSGLLICAMLFFLGAVNAFAQAWNDWHLAQIIGLSEDLAEDARQALTFAVLYVYVGGVLLAAPIFLKPGRWQLDWRMKWPGCGIAILGLLLCGVSLLIWFGNRMGGEGRSERLDLWSNF